MVLEPFEWRLQLSLGLKFRLLRFGETQPSQGAATARSDVGALQRSRDLRLQSVLLGPTAVLPAGGES